MKLGDFASIFDASVHPDVTSGKKSVEQVMKEFVGKWFKPDFDTVITWDDFLDFYKDVSSSVD